VQNKHKNTYRAVSQAALAAVPTAYIQMIETAELVAQRYGVSRQAQDEYALQSQQRTAQAQAAGRFDDEIVPLASVKQLFDKEGQVTGTETVTLSRDEGARADTTLDSLAKLKPVWKGGTWVAEGAHVTAGNASQLSDGASVSVLMSADAARERGLQPLGTYRGLAVAGCRPDEMGIGPVYAIPKLLQRHGLSVADIGLWEINEAFAVVPMKTARDLGLDMDRVNVNGGSIAMGHPLGATGCILLGTLLDELERRDLATGAVTLCVGGGMGIATIIERV